jgi:hypothetical protein
MNSKRKENIFFPDQMPFTKKEGIGSGKNGHQIINL